MTKQEINEFLAERLFGLVRGFDFGSTIDLPANHALYTQPVDYFENWQEVLGMFIDSGEVIRLFRNGEGYSYACQINKDLMCDLDLNGAMSGTTLGEAICRAAVDYLKAQEDDQ